MKSAKEILDTEINWINGNHSIHTNNNAKFNLKQKFVDILTRNLLMMTKKTSLT